MTRGLGAVLLWLSLFVLSDAQPGLLVFGTLEYVDYVKTMVIDEVNLYLRGLQVPDITGDQDGVTFSLVDIGFVTFAANPEKANLTIIPGVGVTFTLTDVYYVVEMGYSFTKDSWPHFGASGIGMLVCNRTTITLSLNVSITPDYNLHTAVIGASSEVGYSQLDGFPSELTITAQDVQMEMNEQLTVAVDTQFNLWLSNPATENYLVEAVAGLSIDLHPVARLDFEPDGIWFSARGAFVMSNTPDLLPPFSPDLRRNHTSLGGRNNIQVFGGEYVVNSLAWQLWNAGNLSATIYNDEIPKSSPLDLNTTNWATYVPPLALHWPDHFMYLDIALLDAPKFIISRNGTVASGSLNATFVVITRPLNVTAFSANITFVGDVTLRLTNTTVFFNILSANFTSLTLMTNNVGNWDPYNLLTFIDVALQFSLGKVNSLLAVGITIPLPPPAWTYNITTLETFDGYVALGIQTTFVVPTQPYVRCPSVTDEYLTCPYLNSCCPSADAANDGYYCCPSPAATCCPGGHLCCPHAYVCVNSNTECQPIEGATPRSNTTVRPVAAMRLY